MEDLGSNPGRSKKTATEQKYFKSNNTGERTYVRRDYSQKLYHCDTLFLKINRSTYVLTPVICLPSSILHFPPSVLYFPSSVLGFPLSILLSISCLPSSVLCFPSSISCFPLSVLCRLHTAMIYWPLSSTATKEVQGPDTTWRRIQGPLPWSLSCSDF